MTTWPHDDTAALIAFYGDPRGRNGVVNQRWVLENIVAVHFPWRVVAAWDAKAVVTSARLHKKCVPAFTNALDKIWGHVEGDYAAIQAAGLHLFGGAFNYRPIRGAARLSCHAFGAALDFDPAHNEQGHSGKMPGFVVDIFKSEGAFWGGDFKLAARKDPMHFQFAVE